MGPVVAAVATVVAASVAIVTTIVSTVVSAKAAKITSEAEATEATAQAEIAEADAERVEERFEDIEEDFILQGERLKGTQVAVVGKSGVTLSSGSVKAVRAETQALLREGVKRIRAEGEFESERLGEIADIFRERATLATDLGRIGVATAITSGAGSLADLALGLSGSGDILQQGFQALNVQPLDFSGLNTQRRPTFFDF